MPGNPVLDLNTRPYRALGTIVADARARTREWGLVEPAEATLYLTAAMDWLGLVSPLIGRVGAADVYLGSSHDLLKVAWHYHWFAIPLALSALLVLGMVWYRGHLTVGFVRREIFDPTTLPLYAALVAQTLDVDDTLLSTRHPFFRDPLEEPFELLAELLLVSGLLLKYCRDWRRAGRPQM